MRRGRILLGGAALAAVGAALMLRTRRGPETRIELAFNDGAVVAVEPDAPDGLELRALAGELRRAFATSSD